MCLDEVMNNGGVFHAGLWGVRQHLSLGQGSSQSQKWSWKLGWGREEKMALRPGCPTTIGAVSRTGGLVAQEEAWWQKTPMPKKRWTFPAAHREAPQLPAAHTWAWPWLLAMPPEGAWQEDKEGPSPGVCSPSFLPKNVLCRVWNQLHNLCPLGKIPSRTPVRQRWMSHCWGNRLSAGIPDRICDEWLGRWRPHILVLII